MAEEKTGFLLYADQRSIFDKLPDDIAGKLIKHIYSYVNDEDPEVADLLMEIAFEPIKLQLKRDLKKWDKKRIERSESGKKGADARWQKMANDGSAIKPMAKMAVTDTVSVTDTVNVKKEYRRFTPPTQDEVCNEMMKSLDDFSAMAQSSKFFDYYTSNGWKVGRNPMKDWKSTVRNWLRNSTKFNNGSNTKTPGGNSKSNGAIKMAGNLKDRIITLQTGT